MCVCVLPISGAKRHEFPIGHGKPFGPGTSEYGRICGVCCFVTPSFSLIIFSGVVAVVGLLLATSFGNILIADENVVRFTSAFVAVRLPILLIHLVSLYLEF